MKPWHIISLCLLTAAFYFFSCFTSSSSSSSSPSISLTGRSSVKMSLPHHKNRYPKAKVFDKDWQSSGKGSMGLKYSSWSEENMDEGDDDEVVAYHIDYHGVTTHPTPTPKHPIPNP